VTWHAGVLHLPPPLAAWLERATARERAFVAVATAIVVVASGYALLWQPLTRDIVRLREEALRVETLLAQARDRTAATPAGTTAPTNVSPAQVRSLVERALNDKGLQREVDVLEVRDERVHVVFSGVDFNALVGWLDALSAQHGIRVAEATLTARVEPGMVRADVAVTR
jgi:general secretion pathway protein M